MPAGVAGRQAGGRDGQKELEGGTRARLVSESGCVYGKAWGPLTLQLLVLGLRGWAQAAGHTRCLPHNHGGDRRLRNRRRGNRGRLICAVRVT